jgi:Myb-like DNA-binding domain
MSSLAMGGGGGHASNNNNKSHGSSVTGANNSTKRGNTSREWTKHEDEMLQHLVEEKGIKNWAVIVAQLPGRKESTCQRRWNKVLKPSLVKGPWTSDEDARLVSLIHKHGAKRWSVTAQEMPGRSSKACRERWNNHLMNPSSTSTSTSSSSNNSNPTTTTSSSSSIKSWTLHEDVAILHHQSQMGSNKWSEMTKFLPGRYVLYDASYVFVLCCDLRLSRFSSFECTYTHSTDTAIKNRWHSSLRRKVEHYLATKLGVADSAIKPDKDGCYEYTNNSSSNSNKNTESVDIMFRAISVMPSPKSATNNSAAKSGAKMTAHAPTTTTSSTGYNPFANLSMYPAYYPPPPPHMPGQKLPFAVAGHNSSSNPLSMSSLSATPSTMAAAVDSAATRHFASPYIRPILTPNPTPTMPSTSIKSKAGRSTSRSGGGSGDSVEDECFSSTKKSIFDDSPSAASLGGGSLGMRLDDATSPGSSLRSLQGIMTCSPPQSHSRMSLMDTFSTPFPVESFPVFFYDEEADNLNKSLFSECIMTPFPKTPGAFTMAYRSASSRGGGGTMIRQAVIRISIGSDATVGANIRNKKIGQKVAISPIAKNAWKGSFLDDDDELSQTLRSLKPVKEHDDSDNDADDMNDVSQVTLEDREDISDDSNKDEELDNATMPPPTAPRVRIDDTVEIATFSDSHQKVTRLSISSGASVGSSTTTPRNINREHGGGTVDRVLLLSSSFKAPSTVDMDRAMKDMSTTPSTAAMSEQGGTSFMSNDEEMSPVPMSLTPAVAAASVASSSTTKPKAAAPGASLDLDEKELELSSSPTAAEASHLGNLDMDKGTAATTTTTNKKKRPAAANAASNNAKVPEAKRSKQ